MRFFSSLPYLLPLLAFVGAQDTDLEQVKFRFQTANIPLDLAIEFQPATLLEVTWPQTKAPSITTTAGDFINQNQTAGPPTFAINGRAAGSGPFVLAMVDPDAPTPVDPTEAQIRHFLGGGFVADARGALTSRTPALSTFLQPNPPLTSTAHRYVFLLFDQSAQFNTQKLVTPNTSRDNFNISAFAAATRLGNPVAGTYIEVNHVNSTTPADV